MRVWILIGVLGACAEPPAPPAESAGRLPEARHARADRPFEPIPEDLPLDARRVELGRRLFEDPRLSGDSERACVDCHALHEGGVVPGERRSNHPLNATGPYNVPTVFNVAFNFRYNWQGRFETLEDHLGGPMMSEAVMDAGSWPEVVERVRDGYHVELQRAGFPEGASERSIRAVLADYQRSLITPGSAFDAFLRGEGELEPDARDGFELFLAVGCASCHQGINVGGNLYQRYGVMEDAFGGREPSERDYGRMQLTGREEDAYVFRVPSLRNVALTAPYFHDGSAETLADAVRHMGRVQLGLILTDDEIAHLVAFLRTLTGRYEGRPLDGAPG